jgi:hypothetical protein
MNVNDVQSPTVVTKAEAASIMVGRQSELEAHYWQIEKRPAEFIEVNSATGQVLIKDFLWRITEEVGEALEALAKSEPQEKTYEEMADALHFVLGLCVITQKRHLFVEMYTKDHYPSPGSMDHFVMSMGILGNTLKMKPWKQTPVLTDEAYFDDCLMRMIASFISLVNYFGMGNEKLYDYYYRKSEVNLFRIRSNY